MDEDQPYPRMNLSDVDESWLRAWAEERIIPLAVYELEMKRRNEKHLSAVRSETCDRFLNLDDARTKPEKWREDPTPQVAGTTSSWLAPR